MLHQCQCQCHAIVIVVAKTGLSPLPQKRATIIGILAEAGPPPLSQQHHSTVIIATKTEPSLWPHCCHNCDQARVVPVVAAMLQNHYCRIRVFHVPVILAAVSHHYRCFIQGRIVSAKPSSSLPPRQSCPCVFIAVVFPRQSRFRGLVFC